MREKRHKIQIAAIYLIACTLIFVVLLLNSFTNNVAGRAFGITHQVIPFINIGITILLLVCIFTMLYMMSKR